MQVGVPYLKECDGVEVKADPIILNVRKAKIIQDNQKATIKAKEIALKNSIYDAIYNKLLDALTSGQINGNTIKIAHKSSNSTYQIPYLTDDIQKACNDRLHIEHRIEIHSTCASKQYSVYDDWFICLCCFPFYIFDNGKRTYTITFHVSEKHH